MGRLPRIEYYGAIYHIIQRGNNRLPIFNKNSYKVYLLELLSEAKEIYDFKIFAYVIMNNHFHFLIQTFNIPINKIMHKINTKYAKYYNRDTDRTGPVFEDRYKGILVQDESYFFTLIKYIHNNPVKANICQFVMNYRWSSDALYRMNVKSIVDIDDFLDMISPDRNRALKKYAELMDEDMEDYEILKDKYENNSIIGSEQFIDNMIEHNKKSKPSLDEILDSICPTKDEFKLIKAESRKRYLTKYKKEYIKSGLKEGYTQKEIGENIGLSRGSVGQLLNK